MGVMAHPETIPVIYKASLEKLDEATRVVMNSFNVPYYVQAQMADEGYRTISDLACRWDSPKDAKAEAPEDYKFQDGTAGYTKSTSLRTAIRLMQAVEEAAQRKKDSRADPSTPDAKVLISPGLRPQMVAEYVARTKQKMPELDEQGSNHYMGLQHKACQSGEVGYFTNKQIISALPEQGEVYAVKRRRKDSSDLIYEHDEETRADPYSLEAWKKQMMIFRTTLLMCIWVSPQHTNIQITKDELDEFYDHIYGPRLAGATPVPSLRVLMIAERKAWRNISLMLYRGKTLSAALLEVRLDHLFWIQEVTNFSHNPRVVAPGAEGKGKKGSYNQKGGKKSHKGTGKSNTQTWGKGAGKQKGQSKWNSWPNQAPAQAQPGSGKGTQAAAPPWNAAAPAAPSSGSTAWAPKDAKGKDFCKKFHIHNNCAGGCGRSHQCPVWMPDGSICNKGHAASQH